MRDLSFTYSLMIVCLAGSIISQPASAQGFESQSPQSYFSGNPIINAEPEFYYVPPAEPSFDKVSFVELGPARTLDQRIQRLIHGIYIDIPPQYDHYGYEIRRYMKSVAGPEVLSSRANIIGQVKNIKTAEIILKYWREAQSREIRDISEALEETNASSTTRSSFRYHRGVATAFFVEAASWMRNNRLALEFLLKIGADAFSYEEDSIKFKNYEDLKEFSALYDAQQAALDEIKEYTPFKVMVY